MIVRSRLGRRETLLRAITDFHGAGIDEPYDILRMLSSTDTGKRGEIYALYRLSTWLDVHWVGQDQGSYDLEARPDGADRYARLQIKAADPRKPWKDRWPFKSLHGGEASAPYDYLLMLGRKPFDAEESYKEREGDYAVFLAPYGMITSEHFGSPERIDLYSGKESLFQKATSGHKSRAFYEKFKATFEEAAAEIGRFCSVGR
jgi:hypothetical protein